LAGSGAKRLVREDELESDFEGVHGMAGKTSGLTTVECSDRGRRIRAEIIFFMKFSSASMIEVSVLNCGRTPGFALAGLDDGIGWDGIALETSGGLRGIQGSGKSSVAASMRRQTAPVARAQRAIQLDRGVTSDEKGTEEILERAGMALSQRDGRLEHHAADEATWTVVQRGRQNRDGIDRGRNDLDAGTYGRSQIYGSVGFIEGSLG